MESTTIEREPSSEPDKPPPKRTYADQLRRLADWIDEHEITNDEIITVGIEIGGRSKVITRDHGIMRDCFPGRTAAATRGERCDMLSLIDGDIRFEGWKFRDDTARETAVTL